MATKTACDVCGGDITMPRQIVRENRHTYWEFDVKAFYRGDDMIDLPKPRDLCVKCLADLVHASTHA